VKKASFINLKVSIYVLNQEKKRKILCAIVLDRR